MSTRILSVTSILCQGEDSHLEFDYEDRSQTIENDEEVYYMQTQEPEKEVEEDNDDDEEYEDEDDYDEDDYKE